MKYLTIVRHAEAEPLRNLHSDFERSLTECGIGQAKQISRKTAQNILRPEMLVSSPAQRAVQTARIFAAAFNIPQDAVLTDMLIYTGSASDMIQVISHWNDAIGSVILFGHNPTVAELTMRLYPQFSGSFPTCSVCSLEFPADSWKKLAATPPALRFQNS